VATGIHGVAAAPGFAIGPVWRYPPRPTKQAATAAGLPGPGAETKAQTGAEAVAAVADAASRAADQLAVLADRVAEAGRGDDAAIFHAQAMMATDPALLDEAIRRVEEGADPITAVAESAAVAAEMLAALEDELLAARAADIRDVGARIGRILRGEQLELPGQPSVAVADDLPPSVTAEIPAGFLLGVALAGGSRTAHAVILARGLGIPAVVGAVGLLEAADAAADTAAEIGTGGGVGGADGGATGELPAPVTIAVDGLSGEILLQPSDVDIAEIRARAAALAERTQRAAALRDRLGATADGVRVALVANIGTPDDAPRALEARAEGVGLFRTEFLYMSRQTPPTEREQMVAYRRVMTAFGPDRPVVIRLADIGGDKGIPYLGLAAEANPFLGVRAIRLAYSSHDLLRTQLRAIWQAGGLAGVTPHIMAPMVATVADVDLLKQLRDEARDDIHSSGLPCAERMVTGIMVEVPSAAIMAAELAPMIDFFSIGTNDLTQYLMAADRGNAILSSLQDALHPAVLRTIAGVVRGADKAGIPVAVCGELAGDPAGALVLVGLGVDELSADAGSLDGIRAALAVVKHAELEDLATRGLASIDAESVRAIAAPYLARRTD
jgi:phosphoenolpyruvate-protein kinase (PTS system EI component)